MSSLLANHMPMLAGVIVFGPWIAVVVWFVFRERWSRRKGKARPR